ncbi:MAG: LysR family transcriptional regulator [Hyphomicrobiales bacterium]
MHLTLRQLLVFKTIVESRGFRKAAEVLYTSQPALSKTIQSLEGAFGFPLLDRSSHTIEMTKAGEMFYAHLDQVFDLIEKISKDTIDVASGQSGKLSITYTDFAILGQLPEMIETLRRQKPEVKIAVRFYPSPRQIELLLNHEVDIGFIWHFMDNLPSNLNCRPISSEGLAAVVPTHHPLASRDEIDLIELREETFLIGDTAWLPFTNLIRDHCLERGFSPKTGQVAYLRDEFFTFVLLGMGILIYPENVVRAKRTGLVALPIRDVGKVVNISAVWHKDSKNPALQSFLDLLPDSAI